MSTRAVCEAFAAAVQSRDYARAAEALDRLRTAVNAGAPIEMGVLELSLIISLAETACEACWRS